MQIMQKSTIFAVSNLRFDNILNPKNKFFEVTILSETTKSSVCFLEALSKVSNKNSDYITLEEFLEITRERGRFILCMILATPFLIPVSIPGSSIPFGLMIMFIGISVIFKKTLIPQKILKYKISKNTAITILNGSITALKKFERIIKPRAIFLTSYYSANITNGVLLVFSAFLLMLPLPVPLTDSLPAYSIFLLCAGILESDGYFIMISYALIIVTSLYFGLIFILGVKGISLILSHLGINFV